MAHYQDKLEKKQRAYFEVGQGKFPKKINLGSRAVGWISSEVNEWIEERIRESRLAEAIN